MPATAPAWRPRFATITAAVVAWAACSGCSGATTGGAPTVDGAVAPDTNRVDEDANGAERDATAETGGDTVTQDSNDVAAETSRDAAAEPPPTTTDAVCSSGLVDIMEACVISRDGALVKTPVAGTMTVTASEQIAGGACRFIGFDPGSNSTDPTTRLTLEGADGTGFMVVMRLPGLPADLFRAGETIELSLDAYSEAAWSETFNQTIAITRGGRPVFVASTLHRLLRIVLPDWTGLGIEIADEGAHCRRATNPLCTFYEHALRVSHAGQSTSLYMGQTSSLSSLDFTVETCSALVAAMCDGPGFTQIGGFWRPSVE